MIRPTFPPHTTPKDCVDLLEDVLKRLKYRRAHGIHTARTGLCTLILQAAKEGKSYGASWHLRDYIKASLKGHAYVNEWLHYQHRVPMHQVTNPELMMDYRIEWCRGLIHEYTLLSGGPNAFTQQPKSPFTEQEKLSMKKSLAGSKGGRVKNERNDTKSAQYIKASK